MKRWFPIAFLVLTLGSLSAQAGRGHSHASLYSTQIQFSNDHVPIVTIGLMESQKRIALSSKGKLRVLTDGPDGAQVQFDDAGRWLAFVRKSQPAAIRWRVQVASHSANALTLIQRSRRHWKGLQVDLKPLELGSVFGFFGKVLDSRRISLTIAREFESREDAEREATLLALAHNTETEVLPVLQSRARGTIVLTNGSVTISAPDVLWLAPGSADGSITVHDVEYGKGFPWHNRQDRQYRGLIYLTVDRGGDLAVANLISSEQLLRGLVPAEIYPSAPQAALKAQAVTARGELLAKIGLRHLADPYLVCGDVHCQVYAGLKREDHRTDQAVFETRGEMLFSKGSLVDAVYCANCGGHTEHNDNVWKSSPSTVLRGRPDGKKMLKSLSDEAVRAWLSTKPASYCNRTGYKNTHFRWSKKVSTERMQSGLQAIGKDPGDIVGISVTRRGVSGRALELLVQGTKKAVTLHGELVIRKAFGSLKSSLFVVDAIAGENELPAAFRFIGGGFGHGVGMCQDGAIGMARKKHRYREILNHYYQEASVERIY
jgi:SpoIID/LytB domain protein